MDSLYESKHSSWNEHHNVPNYMQACIMVTLTPQSGTVCFISQMWGRSVIDKNLTENRTILNYLQLCDTILSELIVHVIPTRFSYQCFLSVADGQQYRTRGVKALLDMYIFIEFKVATYLLSYVFCFSYIYVYSKIDVKQLQSLLEKDLLYIARCNLCFLQAAACRKELYTGISELSQECCCFFPAPKAEMYFNSYCCLATYVLYRPLRKY